MDSNLDNRRPKQCSGIQYIDAVIIGNGPSGICLSYFLDGNVPFYSGLPHSNVYLQKKLEENKGRSLVEQDLAFLSDGIEGRSSNPVALLFDSLTHPDSDLGASTQSILEWKHFEDRSIPHVVLGKRAAGGAWQMMEGDFQTLSLGNWMELPQMPFRDWLFEYRKSSNNTCGVVRDRASVHDVRNYYMQYVDRMNLQKYFRPFSVVTTVERVLDINHSVDDESGEQVPCLKEHSGKFKWEVRGYQVTENGSGEQCKDYFCYRSPNVVLATGAFDLANKLHVPGEHHPYILYSLSQLEQLINTNELTSKSDPVLIIGAGLSAADAILLTRELDIPVFHVFRRDVNDPQIILKKLPAMVYPEYHEIHQLMRGEEVEGVENYKSYPLHYVREFMADGSVAICDKDNTHCPIILKVSYVCILVGSRPDLSFLQQDGRNLGIVPDMPIDSKHNPLDVDPYTCQSNREPGLYAMGPLIGETFVRFLRGGALGITSNLWKKRSEQKHL